MYICAEVPPQHSVSFEMVVTFDVQLMYYLYSIILRFVALTGVLTQLVECSLRMRDVAGSIPSHSIFWPMALLYFTSFTLVFVTTNNTVTFYSSEWFDWNPVEYYNC